MVPGRTPAGAISRKFEPLAPGTARDPMSRGLGRIERAILDLIEDEDAHDVYAAEDAASAIYVRIPTEAGH
jgi:hypothetical protein